jgi:hypothetical protein
MLHGAADITSSRAWWKKESAFVGMGSLYYHIVELAGS